MAPQSASSVVRAFIVSLAQDDLHERLCTFDCLHERLARFLRLMFRSYSPSAPRALSQTVVPVAFSISASRASSDRRFGRFMSSLAAALAAQQMLMHLKYRFGRSVLVRFVVGCQLPVRCGAGSLPCGHILLARRFGAGSCANSFPALASLFLRYTALPVLS
jgi:hypothetical protein